MATRISRSTSWRLALALAGCALSAPAGAQLSSSQHALAERPRLEQVQFREFFPFFWGERRSYNNPWEQPSRPYVDSTKAPPPRKAETPPTTTVLVIGDSFADWLGYGLEEAFADSPEIGVVRKIRSYSGLVRYESHNDTVEWWQAVKDVLAGEKPDAIVVMLGLNDRQALRERAPPHAGPPPAGGASQTPPLAPGREETPAASASPSGADQTSEAPRRTPASSYEFRTDQWADLYGKRIDEMIAALKSKGVPVVWVGLPAIRGTRGTSDMNYLDELYRAHAEKAGITYVDIWDGFVDEAGRYTPQGPDFEGQIRRLRSGDGVHFTKAGAVKLAHYVERDLRRVMSNHVVPVALPGPEQSPKAGAGPRPAIGPVVPLNAIGRSGSGDGGNLLGAGNPAPTAASDPVVTRLLSRGEPIAAHAGRADDFSWPRADAAASGASGTAAAPPAAAAPTAPTPPTPPGAPATGRTGRTDAKRPSNKSEAAPEATPTRPHHLRAELDGAPPRPPMPIAPAPENTR